MEWISKFFTRRRKKKMVKSIITFQKKYDDIIFDETITRFRIQNRKRTKK